ncbi:phosphogluconate dehydrogenase (NAD(+)-dependent, decarboxylating) [Rhodococcus sp. WAY2]|uniref:phosphogluconate dehydrogenase (NAD(+)-dependent, decarboxylating) n=1 Tax=Rhodococcus sp. WAY2 TaxID=2663121 RepID=UPI001357410E|nr:decarboxylating 6-phosphogluconate dehydrogenase [Rhodococcus sp. WAY2]
MNTCWKPKAISTKSQIRDTPRGPRVVCSSISAERACSIDFERLHAMQIGLIGLGKMGLNMRERLRRSGIEVIGYDPYVDTSDVSSIDALVETLPSPRIVWVMVPAGGPTQETITHLYQTLSAGDLVIEGGNSHFSDDVHHAKSLDTRAIGYLDCGVSGGIWGLENGYALMVGGAEEHIARAMPLFDALRPEGPRSEGFVHAGPVGAGHYSKMVHNGIEYGLMQAYAEGFELLGAAELIENVPAVIEAWSRGTVVRSWLLDLLVRAVKDNPDLAGVSGWTQDSGEGRWTLEEAIQNAVPVPVISAALFARFGSRQNSSPAMKAVSALRNQFGGHSTSSGEAAAVQLEAATR